MPLISHFKAKNKIRQYSQDIHMTELDIKDINVEADEKTVNQEDVWILCGWIICFCSCLVFPFYSHLLFSPVLRPTKVLPHPSMSRTCSLTATTVSGCVPSGSARMPQSWAGPTVPQWPSPPSGATWRWAALRPAQGPGPAQSPAAPGGAWQMSSALSSSSWFLPSSPSSSLLSSSTLSLNEQCAPPAAGL